MHAVNFQSPYKHNTTNIQYSICICTGYGTADTPCTMVTWGYFTLQGFYWLLSPPGLAWDQCSLGPNYCHAESSLLHATPFQ